MILIEKLKKSVTLQIVFASWCTITSAFLAGAFSVEGAQVISVTDYAYSTVALMAIWTAREFGEKGVVGGKHVEDTD